MRPTMLLISRFGHLLIGSALTLGSAAAVADVVVVVSSKSPVTRLSQHQIIDIFLGKVSAYPDGSPALALDQMEGAPTRDEFYAKLSNKSAAQLKSHWSKIIFTGRGQPPKEVANDVELKRLLAENPHAISYMDKSRIDHSVRVLYAP